MKVAWNKGIHLPEDMRQNISKALKGRKMSNEWRQNISKARISPIGTLRLHKTQNRWYIKTEKGWMRRNRFIMEQYLKRPLKENEVIHHINENTTDDRIENLQIIEWGLHTVKHWTGKTHSPFSKIKIKENHWSKQGMIMPRDSNGRFKGGDALCQHQVV